MSEPALTPVPDDDSERIPVIESVVPSDTTPFAVAYARRGTRQQESFEALLDPPFAVFRRFAALDAAAKLGRPDLISPALTALLRVALPDADADRLLGLIDGDENEVGVLTARAIGEVVDLLRKVAYERDSSVPSQPGSRSGPKQTGRTSSAGRSAKGSPSTRSRRKKV